MKGEAGTGPRGSVPPGPDAGRILSCGLPRRIRLRRSADYALVNRDGRRIPSGCVIALYRDSDQPHPRFGLAVSRKVGNAVVRNRVKRWLREAIRRERAALAERRAAPLTPRDVVFIARTQAAGSSAAALRGEVSRAFARIWGGAP